MEGWRQYKSFKPDPDLEKPPLDTSPPPAHPSQSDTTLPPTSPPKYVSLHATTLENPKNWSHLYKAFVIAQLTFLTLSLTFASAASAPSEPGLMAEFGCGEIAAIGATSSFLVGMGVGAMPFAPLSECTLFTQMMF
jgi:DHA1 family multidrug resistance protein-like MFS transporter